MLFHFNDFHVLQHTKSLLVCWSLRVEWTTSTGSCLSAWSHRTACSLRRAAGCWGSSLQSFETPWPNQGGGDSGYNFNIFPVHSLRLRLVEHTCDPSGHRPTPRSTRAWTAFWIWLQSPPRSHPTPPATSSSEGLHHLLRHHKDAPFKKQQRWGCEEALCKSLRKANSRKSHVMWRKRFAQQAVDISQPLINFC